jgi:hydroxyacylglutathione hydrolase
MLFKTIPTSQIAPDVYAVRTKYVIFYICKDDRYILCIDAGLGVSAIKKEMKKIQISPEAITHIFLTHSDQDHVAGVKIFSNAKIYISKLEEPLMNGTIKRSRLTRNSKLVRDYETLSDGDIIKLRSIEVKAISTPGHTIGSMSYLINNHLLFVGDAIHLKKDKATTCVKLMNMDTRLQKESLKKLAQLKDISLVCTGHTGISKNFGSIMKEWRHNLCQSEKSLSGTAPIPPTGHVRQLKSGISF